MYIIIAWVGILSFSTPKDQVLNKINSLSPVLSMLVRTKMQDNYTFRNKLANVAFSCSMV